MQTSLDHLPPARQAEFARIRGVILEELETRIKADGKARAKRYRLLKLVLFGSFAKGTWFEDSRSGRASDVDLIYLCFPNNPTGAVADRAYLERVARFALEHDLIVCADECYVELAGAGRAPSENCFHLRDFGLPGLLRNSVRSKGVFCGEYPMIGSCQAGFGWKTGRDRACHDAAQRP